jgi:hypothetical protein
LLSGLVGYWLLSVAWALQSGKLELECHLFDLNRCIESGAH